MAATDLASQQCVTCTGTTPLLTSDRIKELLTQIRGWQLTPDGKRLTRSWRVFDFLNALDFFGRIAEVAEANDHHPDLHLTNYRDVVVEISTHVAGGLTENDFILAAKIDRLEPPKPKG